MLREVSGTSFIVDDERYDIMSRAFLKEDQSAHATIVVLNAEDLFEPDTDNHRMIPFTFVLILTVQNQLSYAKTALSSCLNNLLLKKVLIILSGGQKSAD